MTEFNERTFRLPRIWSNRILRNLGPLFKGDVINVSGWKDQDKEGHRYKDYFPNCHAYYISNFEEGRGADDDDGLTNFLIDLSVPIPPEFYERFDVVFSHTVLEHIFEVDVAFKNTCDMSRDIVILVVPFAQETHGSDYGMGDYWRFTPSGLQNLFAKNNFTIVYETATPYENAGIYLFIVGSRKPNYWLDLLSDWRPIEEGLGRWMTNRNAKQKLVHWARKLMNLRR